MDPVAVCERVAGFDPACRDRDEILAVAADLVRLRRWLDGRDTAVTTALDRVSSHPEKALADATREPVRRAERSKERADLAAAAPALGAALDEGLIGGEHLDALGRGLRRLEPGQRQALLDDDALLASASSLDAEQFAARVNRAVRDAQTDTGMDLLERQRRNTRLRSWVDDQGMWRFSGTFDPRTGVLLAARLEATKDTLFRDAHPETCPSDPLERDHHLAALALAHLLLDTSPRAAASAPEFVAVIDDNCRVHHITWWRHGGRTDLHNLLPLCIHHHTRIHNESWTVTLGRRRELRIELTDGTVLSTGPPHAGRRRAA